MGLLTKQQIDDNLKKYYLDHYGECITDVWYEQPATNVGVRGRTGKDITMVCHILTGVVTEKIEVER